ncbi:MAG: hypothetical protein AABY22_31665, partial [Nanoarchaeota archaeon]
ICGNCGVKMDIVKDEEGNIIEATFNMNNKTKCENCETCPEPRCTEHTCLKPPSWQEEFDKEFPRWEEPISGAGEGIGPLAGIGMYLQYDADRKKRDKEIEVIKSFITQLLVELEDKYNKDAIEEIQQILEAYHDKEANRQIGRNEERERIMEILKPCFDYCREQNGIPECKNCSLSMELFNS